MFVEFRIASIKNDYTTYTKKTTTTTAIHYLKNFVSHSWVINQVLSVCKLLLDPIKLQRKLLVI